MPIRAVESHDSLAMGPSSDADRADHRPPYHAQGPAPWLWDCRRRGAGALTSDHEGWAPSNSGQVAALRGRWVALLAR